MLEIAAIKNLAIHLVRSTEYTTLGSSGDVVISPLLSLRSTISSCT